MASPRRVCIIVNPIAGNGSGPERARRVEKRLRDSGCDVQFRTTDAAGHAALLARVAVEDAMDVALICGGDGTINEAVQGLALSSTALAVMPLGTANIFGRELGLSEGERGVADLVLHGRPRRLDLGRCGKLYFLCVASVGYDAYVTELISKQRKGSFSYLAYVKPVLKTFFNYPFVPLRVRVDGRLLDAPAYHFIVSNTRHYGGPFTMSPQARPDDGQLNAVGFGNPGRLWIAFYMAAAGVRLHHRLPSVVSMTGTTFEVESAAPVSVELDGDFKTHTPVSITTVPKAITVLEPGERNRGE